MIKFLHRNTDGSLKYPNQDDISSIESSEIKDVLPSPTLNRCDNYIFSYSILSKYQNVCQSMILINNIVLSTMSYLHGCHFTISSMAQIVNFMSQNGQLHVTYFSRIFYSLNIPKRFLLAFANYPMTSAVSFIFKLYQHGNKYFFILSELSHLLRITQKQIKAITQP